MVSRLPRGWNVAFSPPVGIRPAAGPGGCVKGRTPVTSAPNANITGPLIRHDREDFILDVDYSSYID